MAVKRIEPRGFAAIGLCRPKYDGNVGGALRAASCFGARMVAIEGTAPMQKGRIERTDPRTTHRHLPVVWTGSILAAQPHEAVAVAVELAPGAVDLPRFEHPAAAFYLFGPEDGSIPQEVIDACRWLVAIPSSRCLNLAAAVNVVLYDRVAKMGER